jgi:hypothetical protein
MMSAVLRTLAFMGASTIGVATCLGIEADARACTCTEDWTLLVPASAEHPRGAALVFGSRCGRSFEPWSVTVDGMPASFGVPVAHGEIATLPIVPTPAVGAEVVVMLDCTGRVGDPACSPGDALVEYARLTIGAQDTIAPPPALDVTFELLEEDGGDECSSIEGHQAIEANVEIGEREPGTWIELVLHRVDGVELVHTRQAMPEDGALTTVFHVQENALDFPEICLDAKVQDASGNVAEVVQDCMIERGDGAGRSLFRRGCMCAAGPAHGWGAALLGLLALMLRRRAPA